MEIDSLIKLKEKLAKLSEEEQKYRDLYLRKLSKGEIQGPPVGIPNIDKPWLKFYEKNAIITKDFDGSSLDFLKEQNKNRLAYTAIEYFNIKLTYKELFEKIDVVAKAFMEMGVKKGDVVTLALPNTPENLISTYALNRIGAVANLIDLRLKGDKLVHAINNTDSKYMIASDLFIDNLDEVIKQTNLEKVVVSSPTDSLSTVFKILFKMKNPTKKTNNFEGIKWDQFYISGLGSTKEIDYVGKSDDVFCILHTSGTTGDSKGVVFTNKNFNAMAEQLENCGFGLEPGHTFMNQVPPFLVFNTLVASHFPLSRGVKMRMLPDYQPDIFYKNIDKYKPNHVIAGPADWGSFVDNYDKAKDKNYDYLMTMVSGSDKFNEEKKDVVDKLVQDGGSTHKVTEGYGMTEVGAAAVTNLPQVNVKGSVGIPLPSVNICIYDNENNMELGYGEVGEICFSGPTVMKEYYNNPEATEGALKEHGDGKIWMHSGDLGYMDKNGSLFLKGRLKRIIVNHEGFKISPLDIERVVNADPRVANCCAIGVDDVEHGAGAMPVVCVVMKEGVNMDEAQIKELIIDDCKAELSERYIPKDVVIKDELPLTPVGKVDYRTLIEEYSSPKHTK